jgi:glycine dehydrogenase
MLLLVLETTLQPEPRAQGEYAGLITIRAYHHPEGIQRTICLIPLQHTNNPHHGDGGNDNNVTKTMRKR